MTVRPDDKLKELTQTMVPMLDNALLAIADTIHLAAATLSDLNQVVQTYVAADKNSFLPTGRRR